jgi:transposase-like protein
MIDGIHLGDHLVLIALGIDFEGKKQVLGLREGHTENGRVVKALLRDLVERGLDPERARLFVIDGAKASTLARTNPPPLARRDPPPISEI